MGFDLRSLVRNETFTETDRVLNLPLVQSLGQEAIDYYVLVTDEDSIVTDYELLESEPTSMHGLVTGVTLLHRELTG